MKPLCVDCDGTLIRGDLLHESLLRAVLKQPWLIGKIALWTLRGRAHLKERLVTVSQPEIALLPFREEVTQFIRDYKSRGGTTLLVTASNELLAQQIAAECGHFDEVLASSASVNLKGARKKSVLVERFGEKGFDYAGDSSSDLPVWASAHKAIVVGRDGDFARRVARVNENVFHLAGETTSPRSWLKLLRIHQWAKNLIIFVPLITSHRILELPLVLQAVTAFFSFSFLASATYIFNDLCDLDNDRAHATKCRRPLAAGLISLPAGALAAAILGIAAVSLGSLLGAVFLAVLAVYFSVSILYSSLLKKAALVDVIVLSGLYIWRLVAGGVATGIVLSNWLLSFALFVFTSLALAKRYVELSDAPTAAATDSQAPRGRGYLASDLQLVLSMGVASALVSVLVVILYVNSPEVVMLYRQPQVLFLLAPLVLFWIGRVWLLASRKELHEDPVLFAVRDKCSYFVAACMFAVVLAGSMPRG